MKPNWYFILALNLLHSIEWPKCISQPSPSTIQIWILHYNGIQILNSVWNVAFGKIIVPFMKLFLILVFILCFFAWARLFHYLDLLSSAFVVMTVLCSSALLVPMALVMSSLYAMSCCFYQNLHRKIRFAEEKKTEKTLKDQLKSCALIRCQIGSLYHMEARAKLTMIDNIVSGIVFMLVNVHVQ